jgi:hypothetical protein
MVDPAVKQRLHPTAVSGKLADSKRSWAAAALR